ncbi:hypothetical protein ACHAP8_011979 [Fusarium lateritium]
MEPIKPTNGDKRAHSAADENGQNRWIRRKLNDEDSKSSNVPSTLIPIMEKNASNPRGSSATRHEVPPVVRSSVGSQFPSDFKFAPQDAKTLGERITEELQTSKELRDGGRKLWTEISRLEDRIHDHQEMASDDGQRGEIVRLRLEMCDELKINLSTLQERLRWREWFLDMSTTKLDSLLKKKAAMTE